MSTQSKLPSLGHLATESANPRSASISALDTAQVLQIINDEDEKVAGCVRNQLPTIARVVNDIVPRLKKGGRVIYFGAGTSGRLGVLDASECLPTFNSKQFIGLIAGGDSALRYPAEGVEDSPECGTTDLKALRPPLDPVLDTTIGIACSGRTPYVKGALEYAHEIGCLTCGIVCVKPSELAEMTKNGKKVVEYVIEVVVGPEVVTGSTRMKAGTATKLVLNTISTGSMIRLGKTYGNYMIDLRVSNTKLRSRAHRFIRLLCPMPSRTPEEIDTLLSGCSNSVKLAILVGRTGWSVDYAKARLECVNGRLDDLLDIETDSPYHHGIGNDKPEKSPLFLCVDGGGTNTRAVIATIDSPTSLLGHHIIGIGSSGPANVSALGVEAAISSIHVAIMAAIPESLLRGGRLPKFEKIWIACAGIDPVTRLNDFELFRQRITESFCTNCTSSTNLKITSDAALLSSFLGMPNVKDDVSQSPGTSLTPLDIDGGIALISGTGSVGLLYSSDQKQIGRVGGLGYLLDDEGSAFHLGKETIRWLFKLHEISDDSDTQSSIGKLVLATYGIPKISDLIGYVYSSATPSSPNSADTPKSRIASLAPGILKLAFEMGEPAALELVQNEARALASLVLRLVKLGIKASNKLNPHAHGDLVRVKIVCTGGMMQHFAFRRMVEEAISIVNDPASGKDLVRGRDGINVQIDGGEMIFVEDPAIRAVEILATECLQIPTVC